MSELTIKQESLPTRCEICHQNDQFDAASKVCKRCAQIKLITPLKLHARIWNRLKPLCRILLIIINIIPISMIGIGIIANYLNYQDAVIISINLFTLFIMIHFLIMALSFAGCLLFTISYFPLKLFKMIINQRYIKLSQPEKKRTVTTNRSPLINPLLVSVIYGLIFAIAVSHGGDISLSQQYHWRSIVALQAIHTAEMKFLAGKGKGNFTANLNELTQLGLLDSSQLPNREGSLYKFEQINTQPISKYEGAHYSIMIVPIRTHWPLSTGSDCFFIDETGIIRHSNRADILADANSETLY